MSELDLMAKIDGDASGFEAAIARAQRATLSYDMALNRLQSDMAALEKSMDDDIAAALERQHQAMTKAGQGMFVFGAAVAAGLGMAANEAIKWESAWTGVTKTVDGSAAEMERLEGGLRQLALTLPATHEEIAAVAEAAGQLGIKREAILGFTKTMIDLSETTNLTADQAATDMARFANIMQTPQDQIDQLGASLVALGNDGASTEADILSMAMRIAGAGATIGLTEGEVMGLANALSSVGIEAEAGGSAISTIMKTIEVASTKGAQALAGYADVAGVTAAEFKTLWDADSAAGLQAFITGLGQVESQGGNAVATLEALGFTQIRQSDALLRLANSGTLLADSLELGNQAWEENTALLEEANKRYATTEARAQIAQNTLRDAAIDVGAVLLPAVAAVGDAVADLGAAWDMLPGPVKTAGVLLGVAAAAIGLFGGAALMAIPKIVAFKATVAGLEGGALKTVGSRLIGLGGFLAGPWGLALGAGVTALTLFAAKQGETARAIDEAKTALDEQTGAITDNTRAWAVKELSESGALETAKRLGLDLRTVTDAALEGGPALEALNGQLAEIRKNATITGPSGVTFLPDYHDAEKLQQVLGDTNGTLVKATSQWRLESEAKGDSADGSKKAAAAQAGTTAAWEDGAAAAGELTEEVRTLKELFEDLSGAFLSQRDASRQVRSSLRDIREGVADYKEKQGGLDGAFKAGTKSGDEFQAMLDGLAQDYQRQIDATAELTGSQKKTLETYRESKAELVEVADQLGLTRKEAQDYAREVLATPELIRTYFDAVTGQAEGDVARLNAMLEEAARARQARIDITTYFHQRGRQTLGGLQEADGGIVQAYADGGFSGGVVQRVPQLRQGGGTVVWNEPETGWEAYISGKPGMEARNREVWLEAGRRLGFDERFADASRSFRGSGGGTRVVEQAAQIDYDRLATAMAKVRPIYGDVRVQDGRDFLRVLAEDHARASMDGLV